jgi:septal ring factor EnvC (AmiA/AmiB activator)
MSRYDDDYDAPDESEDTDPIIRELRTEIIRLEAQLDQLRACVRESTEEVAEIRAKIAEMEAILERLKARRRRDEKLLFLAWLMVVLSLAMSLYTYFTT